MHGWMDGWTDGWMEQKSVHVFLLQQNDGFYKLHTLADAHILFCFTGVVSKLHVKKSINVLKAQKHQCKCKLLPNFYGSLSPELIPVYRQSAYRWLLSHPSGRLPLLSTRPAVTFPAEVRHRPSTKLYCLVTEVHRCELQCIDVMVQWCEQCEVTRDERKAPDASNDPPVSISSASTVLHSGKTSVRKNTDMLQIQHNFRRFCDNLWNFLRCMTTLRQIYDDDNFEKSHNNLNIINVSKCININIKTSLITSSHKNIGK